MINKIVGSAHDAVVDVADFSCVMIGGQTDAGMPHTLLEALFQQGARGLTVVVNYPGLTGDPLTRLILERRVDKIVCTFPRSSKSIAEVLRSGEVHLEVVPQGTLSERIRAGAAGIPAFYTPTSAGTQLAHGKEVRDFDGRIHVLEHALRADVALVRADRGDRFGNLIYHAAARNYNPVMAMSADLTIAEVRKVVDPGELDPESIVTAGVVVDRVVGTGEAVRYLGVEREVTT